MTYWFPHFGPFIYTTKITSSEVKRLKNLISKKSEPARDALAGLIHDEFWICHKKYHEIMKPYLIEFMTGYIAYYKTPINALETKVAWVNYMKAGESNPKHVHLNCSFSSAVYLQIPEGLKEENKNYEGRSGGPGAIEFNYGEEREHNIANFIKLPEVGDLFIFPYNVYHQVHPFKSKGERISIAANFD